MKQLVDDQHHTIKVKLEDNERAKAQREKTRAPEDETIANESSQDNYEDIFGAGGMLYGREEEDGHGEEDVVAESLRAQAQHAHDTCGMAQIPKEEQIRRLNEKLQTIGRQVVNVGDNGDCLFEAACVQYQSNAENRAAFMASAQDLRHQIAAWYRENRMALTQDPTLRALAPEAQNRRKWKSICQKITKPHEWGGEREIIAIASLTQCAVTIVPTVGDTLTYPPRRSDGSVVDSGNLPRMTLGYINGLHYTATRIIAVEADANEDRMDEIAEQDVEADIEERADGIEDQDADTVERVGPRCYICEGVATESTATICPECGQHIHYTCFPDGLPMTD